MDDEVFICRCEEVTLGEIKEAISLGLTTVNEIRRYTRAGMGLCQGKTCGRLLRQVLARELGRSPAEIRPATCRPPVRPVELAVLARGAEGEER